MLIADSVEEWLVDLGCYHSLTTNPLTRLSRTDVPEPFHSRLFDEESEENTQRGSSLTCASDWCMSWCFEFVTFAELIAMCPQLCFVELGGAKDSLALTPNRQFWRLLRVSALPTGRRETSCYLLQRCWLQLGQISWSFWCELCGRHQMDVPLPNHQKRVSEPRQAYRWPPTTLLAV